MLIHSYLYINIIIAIVIAAVLVDNVEASPYWLEPQAGGQTGMMDSTHKQSKVLSYDKMQTKQTILTII